MEAQLVCRGPPIRAKTQKEGSMKGTRREPSFLAVAHPADPGDMKGAQCEPSFLVAADPEAQKEGNMKGTQREPQLLGRVGMRRRKGT